MNTTLYILDWDKVETFEDLKLLLMSRMGTPMAELPDGAPLEQSPLGKFLVPAPQELLDELNAPKIAVPGAARVQ